MKSRVVNIKIPAEIERSPRARRVRLRSASWCAKRCSPSTPARQTARVEQLLYEAVRTRLTLQHYIDHTQSCGLTNEIREVATREAQEYLARLRNRR